MASESLEVLLTFLFLDCICDTLNHCFSTEGASAIFLPHHSCYCQLLCQPKATIFTNVDILAGPVASVIIITFFLSHRLSWFLHFKRITPVSYRFFLSSAFWLVKRVWDLHLFITAWGHLYYSLTRVGSEMSQLCFLFWTGQNLYSFLFLLCLRLGT